MVSEFAPPSATKFLSYITGKRSRPSAMMGLALLIFYRLAHLPGLAGRDRKWRLSRFVHFGVSPRVGINAYKIRHMAVAKRSFDS